MQHNLILIAVFAYFMVGTVLAFAVNALSFGFCGRFEPFSIVVFFAWPLCHPVSALVAAGVAIPTAITWLVSCLV